MNNRRKRIEPEKKTRPAHNRFFSTVSAIVIYSTFSHSFNDFQPGFYYMDRKGERIKKTKSQILDDIYTMAKELYPAARYGKYLALDITWYA